MSNEQFELFLNATIAVCALMALVNLLRYKARGASAVLLGVAFVTLGITVALLRVAAPQFFVYVFAGITGLCLVMDFVVRSAKRVEKEKRS